MLSLKIVISQDEKVTFDNILPSMDICAVYLNDFERPVLTKFVEFLSEKK